MTEYREKAELLIQAERAKHNELVRELRNRADALDRAIASGNTLAIKSAIHYLLDAEYEITGEAETFGFLYEKYGITDIEYERHFERAQVARAEKAKESQ